ncbi:hypothetical protein ACWEKT_24295 [Nocardia takedensis]|uniref:hypothetical protein n=1 Tax=Nocardia takedensis TaxID=259390 RepID=UPI00278C71B1|nr:hypothetical protein [Nocardia takedensis]
MSADAEGIAVYSATAEGMSGEMAAAAAGAAGASPALLGPIMGLIGGDFMAAYSAAHAGHVASIGQLSAVLASLGGATAGAASVLTETDLNNAAALKSTDLDG